MVLLNGVEAGNAREDELAAAAEAGHVVGGDGIDEDDLVSIYDALVDPDFGAEGAIMRNIVLFSVLIYELVGPILTKQALSAAGEITPKTISNRGVMPEMPVQKQ